MILRNPNLKKEIADELQHLDAVYFQFDKAITFKNTLTLFPIKVQDYEEFLRVSSCFTLNKNETTEGLMQTDLDFLIQKIEDPITGHFWKINFNRALELIFKISEGIRCKDCGHIISLSSFGKLIQKGAEAINCPKCGKRNLEEVIRYIQNPKTKKWEIRINDEVLTFRDFERLRQIAIYQNFPDYQDDSWVDPEVREDQRLKNEILAKQGAGGSATLEEKIVAVASQTSYKIDEIYDMPMRKFLLLLSTIDRVIAYTADRIGLMTGLVSTKKPLEHWLYHNKKSMYGEAVTQEAYTQQIAKANSGT